MTRCTGYTLGKGVPVNLKWEEGQRNGTFDQDKGLAETSGSHHGVSGKNGFFDILYLKCIQYEYTHTHNILTGAACSISVTSAATAHLKVTRPGNNFSLRMTVLSGGMGPLIKSDARLIWQANQNDTICETQGVGFIIDIISLQFYHGATVDYPNTHL